MSQREQETGGTDGADGTGITDDQLPDDLVPGEDNPLAEGLPPGEAPDEDLLTSGKGAEGAEGAGSEGADAADQEDADEN